MTDQEKRIEEGYFKYQISTLGIDVYEEGAFRAGYELAESELSSLRSELAETNKRLQEALNFPESKPEQVNWFIANMLRILDSDQQTVLKNYLAPELAEKEKEIAAFKDVLKMVLEVDLKQSGSETSIFTFDQQLMIQKSLQPIKE